MFALLRAERRQRDTEEPNTFSNGKQRLEQRVAELFKFDTRRNRYLTGSASRDLPEIGELDLQRDGAATSPGALAVAPDRVDDVPQLISSRLDGEEIDRKRILGAHALPYEGGTGRSMEGDRKMALGELIGEVIFRAIFPVGILGVLFFVPLIGEWTSASVLLSAWVVLVMFFAFIKTIRRRLPLLRADERFAVFSVFYELAMIAVTAVVFYAQSYKVFGLLEGDKPVTGAVDCLYFSIITWTTLGYGDIPPAQASKLFAASEALFGYVFMGLYLSLVFYVISLRVARENEGRTPEQT